MVGAPVVTATPIGTVAHGEINMWMIEYVNEVKRQLRDVYKFKPNNHGSDIDPCFDHIPDGIYPMIIEGKQEYPIVCEGKFILCKEMKLPPKTAGDGT